MSYRPIVALVVLLLVLSGCGGPEDAIDSGSATAATTLTQQTQAPEDAPSPTEAATDGQDEDTEMSPENCPELVAAISGAANVAAGSVTDNPNAELPVANMRALADRIPEIADDLTIVADAYEAFFERLEELGVDLIDPSSLAGLDPAVMEQVAAAGEALEEGAIGEANENIQAFFERECS